MHDGVHRIQRARSNDNSGSITTCDDDLQVILRGPYICYAYITVPQILHIQIKRLNDVMYQFHQNGRRYPYDMITVDV